MTLTEIMLVRHGRSMLNTQRIVQGPENDAQNGLSEEGKQQVEHLRMRLQQEGYVFNWCYSSPYRRAQETATVLTTGTDLQVLTLNDLREKGQGGLSGISRDHFFAQYPNWQDLSEEERLDFKADPQEETQRELYGRARNTIFELETRHIGKRILAVTHGGFMRSLYQHLLGIPFSEMWSFENCGLMNLHCVGADINITNTFGLRQKHDINYPTPS